MIPPTVAIPPTGTPARRAVISAFVLRTLAWLPVAFAVWYLFAPIVLAPAVMIVRGVARLAWGRIVSSVEQSGALVTFVTTLRPSLAAGNAIVTVDVNVLLYAVGVPLLAALTLAAREPSWKRHLAVGYIVLQPLIAWGVLADFLKNVAIAAAPALASQAGFSAWQREAIAFAYQFGSIILPTVGPIVVWIALHTRFIETLLGRPLGRRYSSGVSQFRRLE